MQLPIERKILVRAEADTDPNHGKDPKDRTVEELLSYGLVIANKQSGPTSHQFTDYVKRILHLDKAGHSGTLE